MNSDLKEVQGLIDKIIELAVLYSFQILAAIIILIVGAVLASWAGRGTARLLQKKNVDITLSNFLGDVSKIIVFAFALIIAMGKFGISIAPFVAALSAVAFGASFAIQGPLSNYGAGISIILSRPFLVGDTISVDDATGTVQAVKLACTILNDEDGVKITIPNKKIVGQTLRNTGKHKIVETKVGISYSSDPGKAVDIVRQTILSFDEVCKVPAPNVGIEAFGDSSIDIGYRYWVPTLHYFASLYSINLAIYRALTDARIDIPSPQLEVRLSRGSTVSKP